MSERGASVRVTVSLVLLVLPFSSLLPLQVASEDSSVEWRSWAAVAWKYFQPEVAWNVSTGLHQDAYGWVYFTDWGLASYILSIVAAQELGLMRDTPYALGYRATKILDFLSTRALSSGVPYLRYSTNEGRPATREVTNSADYGRLLIALYLLKQNLLQNAYPDLASKVDYVVNNYTRAALQLSSQPQNDFYSFYVAQGFKLWGVDMARVERDFQGLQNGPFVNPSEMYGVQGIPSTVRVNPETLVAGLLELDDVPAVTSSPSWTLFKEFAKRVYKTQEARYSNTGQLTAWSEGGVAGEPGFVYEWVVDPKGRSWTITDGLLQVMWSQKDGPDRSYGKPVVNKLPVTFTKIAFALHALFGTNYTRTLVDAVYPSTSDSLGFMEGLWESGGVNSNRQVQTPDLILSAAAYAIHHTSQTTSPTLSTQTSQSTHPSTTSTDHHTSQPTSPTLSTQTSESTYTSTTSTGIAEFPSLTMVLIPLAGLLTLTLIGLRSVLRRRNRGIRQ